MYVLRNKLANVKKTGLRTERELHLELRVTGRLSIDWMEESNSPGKLPTGKTTTEMVQ